MTYISFGPDPLEAQIAEVIGRLRAGEAPSEIEVAQVDVKEEKGRRGRDGLVEAGARENGTAATHLAEEMAWMANTPGGGAIILGIADDGLLIGTELDSEWLRYRIYELTDRKLTVAVLTAELNDVRILILKTHEALEPIRVGGKIKWRVDDNSVEVDATSWHAGKLQRTVDWSALPSGHRTADVNPVALEIARRYLRAGDEGELAGASDEDLIRRLNLVDGDGVLTNAGSLLLVSTPAVGIDYVHRNYHGGDSTDRVQSTGPLIEQVADVERACRHRNRMVHVQEGFAHGQSRAVPPRAVREAIVNGVVHRDWNSPQPTTVEHIGDELIVSSPGGFIGGISPANIITHPAVPRYRALAEAMAAMHLAEREGIGVDRMVRDMLATGRPEPEILELAGPYVRVGLSGGDPDPDYVEFLSALRPSGAASGVDVLLILDLLTQTGWVDASSAGPVLQRSSGETRAALSRLLTVTVDSEPLVEIVGGVPVDQDAAYQLGHKARERLSNRLAHLVSPEGRRGQIANWARARGRVSSTEVASFSKVTVPYAGTLLTSLESEGILIGARKNKRGRGFYYLPVE